MERPITNKGCLPQLQVLSDGLIDYIEYFKESGQIR